MKMAPDNMIEETGKVHLLGYKYELYPSEEQKHLIEDTLRAKVFVYNDMLEYCRACFEAGKRIPTWFDLNIRLTELKKQNPWLYEADSVALVQACQGVVDAYKHFFRSGNSKKDPPVYPKPKPDESSCMKYTTFNKNTLKLSNKEIRLPKLGRMKACTTRFPKGRVKSATISKTATGRYYCSLMVEALIQQLPVVDKEVGIDMGIANLVTDSDGNIHRNPKHYQSSLLKLQKEDFALAQKDAGSKNWEKQRLKVAKLHEKIANQRKDYHHKLSRQYVNENQLICAEELNVKGMLQKRQFSRHIADASMADFLKMLKYKSQIYGRAYITVPRFYPSSQICSNCGRQNKEAKDLSIRMWRCPACGVEHQRDTNAAKNILTKGKEMLAQK